MTGNIWHRTCDMNGKLRRTFRAFNFRIFFFFSSKRMGEKYGKIRWEAIEAIIHRLPNGRKLMDPNYRYICTSPFRSFIHHAMGVWVVYLWLLFHFQDKRLAFLHEFRANVNFTCLIGIPSSIRLRVPTNGRVAFVGHSTICSIPCDGCSFAIRIVLCIHRQWVGSGKGTWPISIDIFIIKVATRCERAHKLFFIIFYIYQSITIACIPSSQSIERKQKNDYWCVCVPETSRTWRKEVRSERKKKRNVYLWVFHSFQFSLWFVNRRRKTRTQTHPVVQ